MYGIKLTIAKEQRLTPSKVEVISSIDLLLLTATTTRDPLQLTKDAYWRRLFEQQAEPGRKMQYFMATGNLVSSSGLDLMQMGGFTVMADKLNYFRFLAHFRGTGHVSPLRCSTSRLAAGVHRGQFFTTMKTTSVRKLLPESWGFMCPVHTPGISSLPVVASQCSGLSRQTVHRAVF